jgi:hypothetical protein
MTKLQFWILSAAVLLLGVLSVTEVYCSRLVQSDERKFAEIQRIAQEGGAYQSKWRQLVVRTYQLGQQAPELKDVLNREHINISTKPGQNTASGGPAEDSAPTNPALAVPAGPSK